ncbi:hypothetical protein FAI40_07535 [Acetobacteraceae bacterium]|nr:hypothetical protein FAI40_07535 [Acetobacteraceae bacterium]
MRLLLILRGAPGCGKSTWIHETGLEPYTISTDQLRLKFGNPTFLSDGSLTINQSYNRQIFNRMEILIRERFRRGDTTIIDSTGVGRAIGTWENLALKYGYETFIVDFDPTLEQCLAFNEKRKRSIQYVSPGIVSNIWQSLQEAKEKVSKRLKIFSPNLFDMNQTFSIKSKILDSYDEIITIGDIHGCSKHLKKLLPNGFEPNKFYIFVGDYIDRGYDNKGTMDFLWENAFQENLLKPNIILLAGNHERHLRAWNNQEEIRSKEFTEKTLPELLQAGWEPKKSKFKIFLRALRSYFAYQFHGKEVFVSHGGLPVPFREIWKISANECEKGWSDYNTDIDRIFSENVGKESKFYQIHGHRNKQNAPILAGHHSFNLEGKVEFDGALRSIHHRKEGFLPKETFIDYDVKKKIYAEVMIPQEIRQLFSATKITFPKSFLETTKAHDGIQINHQKGWENIISISFKRHIFHKGGWDNTTLKARGLFFNEKNGTIAARSYDKFFNIGEVLPLEEIADKFAYPITTRLKENGFLGITGYDEGYLLASSKNYLTGPFAELFQAQISQTLGEKLYSLNKNFGVSCIFEVIDPANDPHIISYPSKKLILLDVIYRNLEFKKLPYDHLKKVAEWLEVELAPLKAILPNKETFLSFLKEKENEESEGYVFEDQRGFMVKSKSPYYYVWKALRSTLSNLLRGNDKHFPKGVERLFRKHPLYFNAHKQEELRAFFNRLLTASEEDLRKDIVSLRKEFLEKQ